jgi:hypothetical protein
MPRKTKKTPDIVAAVAANMKKDWPVTCKDITLTYGGIQWDKAQHSLRKPRADLGMGSAETLTLTSLPLPSGDSWTAATSASGSTMD